MAHPKFPRILVATLFCLCASCGGGASDQPGQVCESLSGSPWLPREDPSRPDPASLISEISLSASGTVMDVSDPIDPSRLISFDIPMEEDLGPEGSLALMAQAPDLAPILLSLHDGMHEWISVGCGNSGLFQCSLFGCSAAEACSLATPSAYLNVTQWLQRQMNPFAPLSVNVFPTCNWDSEELACGFNTDFFANGNRLRSGPGVKYTARYLVLGRRTSETPLGNTTLSLHVIKKQAQLTPPRLNFNMVLVGTRNIQASRTPKGKANLDALVGYLEQHYAKSGVLQVGSVHSYEWPCEMGGDAFASLDVEKLGDLFKTGSSLIAPAGALATAVNLFLISDVSDDHLQGTLLGVAGGIPGPATQGTGASGVAITTFNRLDQYNARCPSEGPCPRSSHDEEFWTLGTTISHETGHFLGLNHPSEGDGTEHDSLPDTPECTRTDPLRGNRIVTVSSCSREVLCREACPGYDGRTRFCSEEPNCQFNHLMWWTVKNYNPETAQGDGNLLTAHALAVLLYHPLVRP